jgi:lysozyme family protein
LAAANYQSCLAFTLKYEGGDSDDPADPGGRTRKGVTQATYDAYRDRLGLPRRDVFAMADGEMQEIYRGDYWNVVNGDDLRPGEDLCVFDLAVNSGPAKAKSFWRMTGGAQSSVDDVIHQICESRLTFLRSLRTWSHFGTGWEKRVNACQAIALKMAEVLVMAPGPVPQPAAPVPVPQAPVPELPGGPLPPVPAPPAGAALPGLPISPTSAGRIASGTDTLVAMRNARIAELVSEDPEIAAYDAALAAFGKLVAIPAIPAQVSQRSLSAELVEGQHLQNPAAEEAAIIPQRKISMPNIINWQTSLFGSTGIIAAVYGVYHAVSTGTPIDATQVALIVGMVSQGIGLLRAKDANVTGGTVPQTQEAATRAKSQPIK